MKKSKIILLAAFLALAISVTFLACGGGGGDDDEGSGNWCLYGPAQGQACVHENYLSLAGVKSCNQAQGEFVDDCEDYGFVYCKLPDVSGLPNNTMACSAVQEGLCNTVAGLEIVDVDECEDAIDGSGGNKPGSSGGNDPGSSSSGGGGPGPGPGNSSSSEEGLSDAEVNVMYDTMITMFGTVTQGTYGCIFSGELYEVFYCQWQTDQCYSLNEDYPGDLGAGATCRDLIKYCIKKTEGNGVYVISGEPTSEVKCTNNSGALKVPLYN